MEGIGITYDGTTQTNEGNSAQAYASTTQRREAQGQNGQAEPEATMKYHHLKRSRDVRRSITIFVGRAFYAIIALLLIFITWDLFFNYGYWTVETIYYLSERL